jgi:hypothetical protein
MSSPVKPRSGIKLFYTHKIIQCRQTMFLKETSCDWARQSSALAFLLIFLSLTNNKHTAKAKAWPFGIIITLNNNKIIKLNNHFFCHFCILPECVVIGSYKSMCRLSKWKKTSFFPEGKRTSLFSKMEDDLNFFKMEDNCKAKVYIYDWLSSQRFYKFKSI